MSYKEEFYRGMMKMAAGGVGSTLAGRAKSILGTFKGMTTKQKVATGGATAGMLGVAHGYNEMYKALHANDIINNHKKKNSAIK
jgi:NAD(P)H-hydrate repair Nnr-like enzyme with NAD(P)H-hydrate dehydratase domain